MTSIARKAGPLVAVALATLVGCRSTYYSVLEKFGIEKREILVDRVGEARDAQTEAKEQFESALDRFRSVVAVDAGDLEESYDDLSQQFERSEDRAQEVGERIDAVEEVAGALFDEWEAELDEYASDDRREQSERLLEETRQRYEEVLAAMRRAESSMEPVLAAFRDQVLVLKHNLNARAIGGLKSELDTIERDVAQLIADMELSIAEANAFIESMS